MKQADLHTLKSITELEGGHHWETVRTYLEAAYNDTIQNLLHAPADELQKYRGEAMVLKDLVDTINEAPDVVKRATESYTDEFSTTGIP